MFLIIFLSPIAENDLNHGFFLRPKFETSTWTERVPRVVTEDHSKHCGFMLEFLGCAAVFSGKLLDLGCHTVDGNQKSGEKTTWDGGKTL